MKTVDAIIAGMGVIGSIGVATVFIIGWAVILYWIFSAIL